MKPKHRSFDLHLGTEVVTNLPVYQSILERAKMAVAFGQTGSGKSESIKYQSAQLIKRGHGCLCLDSHGPTARALLDEVLTYGPRVTKRVLYISSRHPEATLMLDLLERHATEPLHRIAERDTLAKDLSQVLVRTAGPGGADALQGMVRLLNNLTLAFHALYDAQLPIGFMPFLFFGPSPLLDAILARTRDETVQRHFRKIAELRPADREKYTESVVNRLHQLLSYLLLRTQFAQHGDITVSRMLAEDRVLIADLGPAPGTAPEHARLLESILIGAYFRAAQRRSEAEALAHPCHLVLEEAATVVSPAEIELLAQSRKFGFWANPLIFQGFEGLKRGDLDLIGGVLNNSGTKMVFRLGNDQDAKRLAEILYAAQVDPRRVLAYHERTAQRVKKHQRIETESTSTSESERGADRERTHGESKTRGIHFLPEYEQYTEQTPVYMSTSDQFLEAAALLMNFQPGHFLLQTPSVPQPRLCYSPMLPDPYRCMPGMRERRRQQFLQQLFGHWPYRDTLSVLTSFDQLVAQFQMPGALPPGLDTPGTAADDDDGDDDEPERTRSPFDA